MLPFLYIFFRKKKKGKKKAAFQWGRLSCQGFCVKYYPVNLEEGDSWKVLEFYFGLQCSKDKIGWRFHFKTRRAWPLQVFLAPLLPLLCFLLQEMDPFAPLCQSPGIVPQSFLYFYLFSRTTKKKSPLIWELCEAALYPKDAQRVLLEAYVMHTIEERTARGANARQQPPAA